MVVENWLRSRGEVARSLVEASIRSVALRYKVTIGHNPVNRHSLPHFIRSDVVGKKMCHRFKTARTGILGGVVPTTTSNRSAPFFHPMDPKYFVGLDAVVDESGRFITSDIDALFITNPNKISNELICCSEYGDCTRFERDIMIEINKTFRSLSGSSMDLFTHGPANRSPISRQDYIHFPFSLYLDTGELRLIGDEEQRENSLQEFYSLAMQVGAELNPVWNLCR